MADVIDPADNLPASQAGEWAAEKHRLLSEYIHAARDARKKWKYGKCGYVDLFSGPGRQALDGELIDGSPLRAWEASLLGSPFGQVFISDKRRYAEACAERLRKRGAPVEVAALSATEAAVVVARKLDPKGLHLAFVDPYGIKQLEWSIFDALIKNVPRIDFIVHVSAQGVTRNLDRFIDAPISPIDDVAPGWRESVTKRDEPTMRGQLFFHWLELFRERGFIHAKAVPLVKNSTNAPLYRMVLLSKHPLAAKLWNSVARDPWRQDLFA